MTGRNHRQLYRPLTLFARMTMFHAFVVTTSSLLWVEQQSCGLFFTSSWCYSVIAAVGTMQNDRENRRYCPPPAWGPNQLIWEQRSQYIPLSRHTARHNFTIPCSCLCVFFLYAASLVFLAHLSNIIMLLANLYLFTR